MLILLDYGLGNIRAFANIYKQLNIPTRVASSVGDLEGATKLILPGVGAFDYAMERFNSSGMRGEVDDLVLNKHLPVMGICVGMQMMAKRSEEGKLDGLGWIDGEVKRMNFVQQKKLMLPHMGWNSIKHVDHKLFEHIESPLFYFLHSYYFSPATESDTLARTFYAEEFSSVVAHNHIIGVQFHPEKSHTWGIQLLKNFAESL